MKSPLRGSVPKEFILTDAGPSLFWKQGERVSQRKGERAADVSLMWEVTSVLLLLCPPSTHCTFHLPGPRPKLESSSLSVSHTHTPS